MLQPTDGRAKAKMTRLADLVEAAVPIPHVRAARNIMRVECNQRIISRLPGLFQHRQLEVVETHHFGADRVYGYRIETRRHQAAQFRLSHNRTVSLRANDSVDQSEIPKWRCSRTSRPGEMEQRFVDVQGHPPSGVVSVPVAGSNHAGRIS